MRRFGLLAVVTFGVFVAVVLGVIYRDVRKTCLTAGARYQTNCQKALMKTLESSVETKENRTRAVWALGQLARKESLPVLKAHLNDELVDQDELSKEIRWCEKGNVTSWMYGDF